MKKYTLILVLFTFILLENQFLAQGCSQCKMLAEQGSELDEASFGSAINTGILYLMLIPYFLLLFLFRKRIFLFFKSFAKK